MLILMFNIIAILGLFIAMKKTPSDKARGVIGFGCLPAALICLFLIIAFMLWNAYYPPTKNLSEYENKLIRMAQKAGKRGIIVEGCSQIGVQSSSGLIALPPRTPGEFPRLKVDVALKNCGDVPFIGTSWGGTVLYHHVEATATATLMAQDGRVVKVFEGKGKASPPGQLKISIVCNADGTPRVDAMGRDIIEYKIEPPQSEIDEEARREAITALKETLSKELSVDLLK